MSRLSAIGILGDEELSALAQARIFSAEDVLRADISRLVAILGGPSALQLRADICSFPLQRKLIPRGLIKLPTGIGAIDFLTGGGLESGSLAELCGASGSGKSRIALAVAAYTAGRLLRRVVFIDTKGDFSIGCLSKFVSEGAALERIQVFHAPNPYLLLSVLHSVGKNLEREGRQGQRLIVIDSITAPFLHFLGKPDGSPLLVAVSQLLRQITITYNLCALVTNLEVGDCRPALGRVWAYAPTHRFMISKNQITLKTAVNPLIETTAPFTPPNDSLCS